LDILQEMVRTYGNDSNFLYLFGLLAEHADEDEMTAKFLLWVKSCLDSSK